MATRTGTLTVADLLAVNNLSVTEFGADATAAVLAAELDAHNTIVRQLVTELCDVTTDVQRKTGMSTSGEMLDADEFSRVPTQKSGPPSQVAFPLLLKQYAIGWTTRFLSKATPADLVKETQAARKAHLKAITREIKRAIYGSANYAFVDDLTDGVSYTIRRFLNADGSTIAEGPNGEVFDANAHQHYLAINGLTATAGLAAIDTLVEHDFSENIRIYINKADESAWRALTGFVAYPDPRITLGTANNQPTQRLDITRADNRAIGIFGAAEVWTKPWALPNYPFLFSAGATAKPLAIREDRQGSLNLRIAAELNTFPLNAQYMESAYGVAVNTRANGAVLYTGGGTYTDPVI